MGFFREQRLRRVYGNEKKVFVIQVEHNMGP
ncbi:MAG: hypothetical protein Ct9H300mP32_4300 [Verrucomicrobiota bacterium]|nr:MAG: hypothetical protein Ct9H300mP32_4300 [Verrucomicrobiota bacterium]